MKIRPTLFCTPSLFPASLQGKLWINNIVCFGILALSFANYHQSCQQLAKKDLGIPQ